VEDFHLLLLAGLPAHYQPDLELTLLCLLGPLAG
jgi:hypothetical protein